MASTLVDQIKTTEYQLRKIANFVGFDVFQQNYKMNLMSYIVIFDIITYMTINIYDVYLFWGDLVRVCFCLVTWSLGYQGSIRIITFLTKKQLMKDILNEIYIKFSTMGEDIEMRIVLKRFVRYIQIQSKIMIVLIYSAGVGALVYPLLIYLMNGEKMLPFGFVIPGLSDTEGIGYILNYGHHIIQVAFTCSGLSAAHGFNIIFLLYGCAMTEIIIIKLKNIGHQLGNKNKIGNQFEDVNLQDVIKFHQDTLKCVANLENTFSLMFMIDAICIPFQVIITLFVCSSFFWVTGYLIMVAVSFMLLIICCYGTFLEKMFDDLCLAVYDVPWHLMTIKDRKTIHFMLTRTQKPPKLTFGKMAKINMNTFVAIYKTVYSYFMVLKSSTT